MRRRDLPILFAVVVVAGIVDLFEPATFGARWERLLILVNGIAIGYLGGLLFSH
jgi:hypothetical protein